MKLFGVESDEAFWLLWALFTLLMLLALGLPLSWALSRSGGYASFFMRDRPDGFPLLSSLGDAGAPDDVAALALLFDESGLWHDPTVAGRRRSRTFATRRARGRSSASGGRATATCRSHTTTTRSRSSTETTLRSTSCCRRGS